MQLSMDDQVHHAWIHTLQYPKNIPLADIIKFDDGSIQGTNVEAETLSF
jgi:hypothetical protein